MGFVPSPTDLHLDGLDLSPETIQALLKVDPKDWTEDLVDQRAFFDEVGTRLPPALRQEQKKFETRLGK